MQLRWLGLLVLVVTLAAVQTAALAQAPVRVLLPIVTRGAAVTQAPQPPQDRPDPTPTPEPTATMPQQPIGPTEASGLAYPIDGDTILVSAAGFLDTARYIGIDAPDRRDCFYTEARQRNGQLIANHSLRLEFDTTDRDEAGNLVRHVWTSDGLVGWILVREGYARARPTPPNTRYGEEYAAAEAAARREQRGLWSACAVSTNALSSGG